MRRIFGTALMALCLLPAVTAARAGDITGHKAPRAAEEMDVLQKGAIASGKYLLVDFGLDRCSSCIRMRKLLEGIRDEISPTVITRILNINKEADLSAKYHVMLIPAQIIISPGGELVYEHTGVLREKELREALQKAGAILSGRRRK